MTSESSSENVSMTETASVVTITSSLRAGLLREEYGREFNTFDLGYNFPSDEEEWDRLGRALPLPLVCSTLNRSYREATPAVNQVDGKEIPGPCGRGFDKTYNMGETGNRLGMRRWSLVTT